MAYGSYKDLVKRTGLASMIYKVFDKESTGSGIQSMSNEQLANEFHKPIIKKFKRCKVYSSFKDSIWQVDLIDMQLISKYSKGTRFFLFAIDICNVFYLLLLRHFKLF